MSKIAPRRALAQVDRAWEQERMRQADRTVRPPELLALARHYEKTALDTQRRLARLDPSQHTHGCRCILCDQRTMPCTVPGCTHVARGAARLAGHLARHKREARAAARVVNARTKLAGQTFLEALLGNPERATTIDLRALRAFEEQLRVASGGRRVRRTGATKAALDATLASPERLVTCSGRIPAPHAAIIYRLALLAAISPQAVTAALIAWGIEKFATDCRAGDGARTPHIPATILAASAPADAPTPTAAPPSRPVFYPSADADEEAV